MKLTFLGTGTSHGVPMIDCMLADYVRCPKNVCREAQTDPRHRRTRSSVLVEYNGKTVLIDVSADFREQALREHVRCIDAVLLTHRHADHIMGIPDIRSYNPQAGGLLDVYASAETLEHVQETFGYAFDPNTFVGGGIPRLAPKVIDGPFELFGKTVVPVPVSHGPQPGCLGFRIGPLAYIPDIKEIREADKALVKGVKCLILNCLRDVRPHPTHLLLEQSMALAREIAPDRCWFIHMGHDIHYGIDSKQLDDWMAFSYDGLKIDIWD